jgi:hypothetical protein
VDVLLLPFRAVPDLPLYMALNAALALVMYPVIIGVSRLAYGPARTAEARPAVRRVVLAYAVLAPLLIYVFTFVLVTLFGYQS